MIYNDFRMRSGSFRKKSCIFLEKARFQVKILPCSTFIFIFRYQYFMNITVPEWLLLKKKLSDTKTKFEAHSFA